MKRTAWLALALVVAGLQAGCVTRRVMITSDPPGAVVYRNGQPIGATPVEESFLYYGKYRYRFVKDGYQPLDIEPCLSAPWYEYPPLDFISENVIPFNFRDIHQVHVKLIPLEPVRQDDVKAAAEALRVKGQAIQSPPDAQPRRQSAPPPLAPPPATSAPPIAPPGNTPSVLPAPVPIPQSGNVSVARPGTATSNKATTQDEDLPSAGFSVLPNSGGPSRRVP
jgi:hypothetical protein